MPGIDGLRVLAVGGGVGFHLPAIGLVGGYPGVDLFLVISGYLITALSVAEADVTGRIPNADDSPTPPALLVMPME